MSLVYLLWLNILTIQSRTSLPTCQKATQNLGLDWVNLLSLWVKCTRLINKTHPHNRLAIMSEN